MRQLLKITLAIAAIALSLLSCKKDQVEDPNVTEYRTDLQQFEAVWNGLNTAYVLWPIDDTDWDAVYEHYHPIFEEMEGQSNSVWASTWKELTSTLIDHHLKINLERPSTGYKIEIIPGFDEVKTRGYFHWPVENYNRYIRLIQLQLNGRLTNVMFHQEADYYYVSGILDNDIAYFYCSSFTDLNSFLTPFMHFKDLVASPDIKAAIIDIRDNGGGDGIIPYYIISCFSTECVTVGYNQTKIGLGRYEFGPKLSWEIGAIAGIIDGQERNIPVVALTNIISASASEIATIAVKQLPQGYVVGERTFGATCALNDNFGYFYSGSFGDSQGYPYWTGHGHYVYTPKFLFTSVDGTVYEGHGIEPDAECLFDQSAWNNGVDNQLECAVSFAKDKISGNE